MSAPIVAQPRNTVSIEEQQKEATSNDDEVVDSLNNSETSKDFKLTETIEVCNAVDKEKQLTYVNGSQNVTKALKQFSPSSIAKTKNVSKTPENVTNAEDERKKKSKHKSKLSLTAEVKKSKLKEDTSQVSITSFFQKMSPKTPENKSLLEEQNTPDKLHQTPKKDVPEKELSSKLLPSKVGRNCELKGGEKCDLMEAEEKQVIVESSNGSPEHIKSNDKCDATKARGNQMTAEASVKDKIRSDQKTKKIKRSTPITNKADINETESTEENVEKSNETECTKTKTKPRLSLSLNTTSHRKYKKNDSNNGLTDQPRRKEEKHPTKAIKIKLKQQEKTSNGTQREKNRKEKPLKDGNTVDDSKQTKINKEDVESSTKTNKQKKLANSDVKSKKTKEKVENQNETKENKRVRFAEEIREFSPEPIKRSSSAKVQSVENPKNTNLKEDKKEPTNVNENSESSEDCAELKNVKRNAFTFMMDNRHKSIGQNSPGRDAEDSQESPELRKESRKKLLARKATFQDWADMKGAKKRKIEDEETGIVIEHKLKRRAKRLKKLLTKQQTSVEDSEDKEEIVVKKHKVNRIIESGSECTRESCDVKRVKKGSSKRKRKRTSEDVGKDCNIQQEVDDAVDDEIFLKHKKPNLIFSDSSNELNEETFNNADLNVTEETASVSSQSDLKKSKNKQTELSSFFAVLNNKKHKNKQKPKLALKNNDSNNSLTSDDFSNSHTELEGNALNKCKSPMIEVYEDTSETNEEDLNMKVSLSELVKKKEIQMLLTPRTVKKWRMRLRIKLSEGENETIEKLLHPHLDKIAKSEESKNKKPEAFVSSDSDSDEPLSSKKYYKDKPEPTRKSDETKPLKLAPLFIKAKPKPKLDKATIEARKQFLHSGLPESLKKVIEKQQRTEEVEYPIFPEISHVTIKPTNEQLANSAVNFWSLPAVDLNLKTIEPYSFQIGRLSSGSVTENNAKCANTIEFHPLIKPTNIKSIIKTIKTEHPDYPVYKAFRFLHQKHLQKSANQMQELTEIKTETIVKKRKRGRPKKKPISLDDSVVIIENKPPEFPKYKINGQELWTDLYRPSTSEEIFGNHGSVKQLKTWLKTWLEFSEEINIQKRGKGRTSDSGSDFESTDVDSRNSLQLPGNTMILYGPHGSGKTSAVYALCNELGVNVLELNASSKRTGKRLLLEMQEATQSHQVGKKDTNSLTTFLKKDENTQSLQTSDNKMCLLLIEDVDIVFEQDETFISALAQLLTMSKRPIVLTTTDMNCLHLKKFFAHYPVITFIPLSSKVLAIWLQMLCLLEGLVVDKRAVAELLAQNKGDVRRTLLQLQFWVQSGGQAKSSEIRCLRRLNDSDGSNRGRSTDKEEKLCKDDSSNTSWFNEEESEGSVNTNVTHFDCLGSFGYFKPYNTSYTSVPVDLGNVWWNLSSILNIPVPLSTNNKPAVKSEEHPSDSKPQNKSETQDLKNVSDIFETLAATDVLYEKLNVDCDLEPVHKSRESRVRNSLEISESLESYNVTRDLSYEWSHTLLNGQINLHSNETVCDSFTYSAVNEKQWRAQQNRCKETLLEAVPVFYNIDRNCVNMDYLSTLRTMARSEVIRANTNNKRGNRFYNYLRGLGISCSDSLLQTACNVFHSEM